MARSRRHLRPTPVAGTVARLLMVAVIALSSAVVLPSVAQADGDPGSDVLVYQQLFLAGDAGVPFKEQVQLGNLLHQAAKAGFPIRVAIIAKPDDLGAVTALWRKPHAYARFLGLELSLAYHGRLLVVMPNGLGFNYPGHRSASAYRLLDHVALSGGGAHLATEADRAVTALAAAAGVHLSPPASAGTPARTGGNPGSQQAPGTVRSASGSTRALAFFVLALLAAAVVAARLLFARHSEAIHAAARRARGRMPLHRLRSRRPRARAELAMGLLATLVIAIVLGAGGFLAFSAAPQTRAADALGHNPVLDPGTALSRPARNFTLTNQFGQRVSLRSFRGRVVILGFNDSECTTMCPLTTTAMLDAKAMLGSSGARVQLLGVDANPKATSIEDVLSYSEVHGMLHAWDFLTGSPRQLRRVWHEYSIGVEISHNLVDHDPAIFVIGPDGRIAKLFMTQQSYAAVGQLAQLLADEVSKLLPDHPHVNSHLSYAHIKGISPTTRTTIARAGGGKVMLGPGRARVVLFFATWDRQITGLAGGLEALKRYQSLAVRTGLPQLTSIDEGSVEPRGALHSFLRSLPSRLNYPVGIDTSGRVGDGYEVDGQPWLMILNSAGKIAYYYSVAAAGWPTTARLAHLARVALQRFPASTTSTTALASAPPALASLHRQSAMILGGYAGLERRIRSLRGYPIVLNVWASWCIPCREEFNLFAAASARYGHSIAFLGANADDSSSDARAFLRQHPVSYPSYAVSTEQLNPLASIEGLPTTIFISRTGKVRYVHTGQYDSQGVLDSDIATYASPKR